ncbi:MAG: MdtA/MuxA family multidrug efflux RND transporter periplasmic adaptor subunit [Pseudomonadota bacterium]
MSAGPDQANSYQRATGAPRKRRSKWWWLVGVVVIASIGWIIWSAKNQPAQAAGGRKAGMAGKAMTVNVAAARSGDVNLYLFGLGTVTPLATVTVKPRVDGQLMRILFKEGQEVKAGDLLAEIDPRPFQVQLSQAQGQHARDQAQLEAARLDLERYNTLYTQDSIAKQQVDQQASLVKQYEGTVKTDQAAVDDAKLQLVYSRVTAPVSGRVGLRQVDPGNIVSAGDANGIVVITQLKPINVQFSLPEDSLQSVLEQIRAGTQLPVEAYDRAQTALLDTGSLVTIDNQIDPTTGSVKLKSTFANKAEKLFPNQFVNVRMLLTTKHGVTLIPSAAIQQGASAVGTYVYVLQPDSTVSVRKIKVGAVEGDNTEIVSGLKIGEQVVIDGVDKLREGAKVALPNAKPADGAAASDGKKKRHEGGNGDKPRRKRPAAE